MSIATGIWEFLSRDVAFFGGPHSPMLSWLGSLGILTFFLWHVFTLRKEVFSVRQGFEKISPMLAALVNERGEIDRERFFQNPKKGTRVQGSKAASSNTRIDCDDLHRLDAGMEKEPMFRSLWAQYRMTLILEQVPWFLEPRIFSTKRAEEIFTQEALLANRVNLLFYSQFPSLVTGIGLLLTFIALFIGLGKLHADGSEIVGIQGLINGLAGKFLTSIVGLIVANLFTFIEKPIVSQLMNTHHSFLGLIDQLFPRKTMEQILEQLTSIQGKNQGERSNAGTEIHVRSSNSRAEINGLVGPVANLTSVVQSLRSLQEGEHAKTRQVISELPRVIRDELHAPLRELTDTIYDLTKTLKEAPLHRAIVEPASEVHSPLWKDQSNRKNSSGAKHARKTAWPRWPRLDKLRRTA